MRLKMARFPGFPDFARRDGEHQKPETRLGRLAASLIQFGASGVGINFPPCQRPSEKRSNDLEFLCGCSQLLWRTTRGATAGRSKATTLPALRCRPHTSGVALNGRQRPATCRHPQGRQRATGRRPNSQRPRQPARNARRAAKRCAWRHADRPTRRREPRTAGRRANVTATVAAGRRGRVSVPPARPPKPLGIRIRAGGSVAWHHTAASTARGPLLRRPAEKPGSSPRGESTCRQRGDTTSCHPGRTLAAAGSAGGGAIGAAMSGKARWGHGTSREIAPRREPRTSKGVAPRSICPACLRSRSRSSFEQPRGAWA